MSERFDCIVIGAGILGAACFSRLSAAKLKCLLLESHRPAAGATGYSGCIVRVAHSTPVQVMQAAEGYHAYDALARRSIGAVPFQRSGYLHFDTEARLEAMNRQLSEVGVEAQLLGRQELRTRYAGFPIEAEAALLEPGAGFMDAHATVSWYIREGVRRGGVFQDAAAVHRLRIAGGRVLGVESSLGPVDAPQVVLALGGGVPSFLDRHDITGHGMWSQLIQVTRFTAPQGLEAAPCFIDDLLHTNGRWCPMTRGLFVGHPTGKRLDGAFRQGEIDPRHAELTRRTATPRFPWLQQARTTGALCHSDCYSSRPEGITGRLPGGPEGLLVASGFSGGGFKMAPFAAEAIAQAIA